MNGVEFPDVPKRHVILQFTPELLEWLLRCLPFRMGLPEDFKVVSFHIDPTRDLLCLRLSSKTFEVTHSGEPFPYIGLKLPSVWTASAPTEAIQ